MQSVEGVKCTELPEMFIIMREKFLEQQIINFPGSPAQVLYILVKSYKTSNLPNSVLCILPVRY